MFPSVPTRRAGLRLTVTPHLRLEDIDGLLDALARAWPTALERYGLDTGEILDWFARARVGPEPPRTAPHPPTHVALPVSTWGDAHSLPAAWDRWLGSAGCVSAASVAMQQEVFAGPEPQHDWSFLFVAAGDPERPVAATVFAEMLFKDDFLSPAPVSEAIEVRRAEEPLYLTSRVLMMGGGLSEGNHLYVDRDASWEAGLRAILRAAVARYDDRRLDAVILRDLPEDPEVDAILSAEGFVRFPMPPRHRVDVRTEAFLAGGSTRTRRFLARIREAHDRFQVRTLGEDDLAREGDHLHRLYLDVARRNRKMNSFDLPRRVLDGFVRSTSWELRSLYLPVAEGGPGPERAVSWFAGHRCGEVFAPLLCGLDYDYVHTQATYRHTVLEALLTGRATGATEVRLGMMADQEKKRFGSRPEGCGAWMMVRDSYRSSVLGDQIARVALRSP